MRPLLAPALLLSCCRSASTPFLLRFAKKVLSKSVGPAWLWRLEGKSLPVAVMISQILNNMSPFHSYLPAFAPMLGVGLLDLTTCLPERGLAVRVMHVGTQQSCISAPVRPTNQYRSFSSLVPINSSKVVEVVVTLKVPSSVCDCLLPCHVAGRDASTIVVLTRGVENISPLVEDNIKVDCSVPLSYGDLRCLPAHSTPGV